MAKNPEQVIWVGSQLSDPERQQLIELLKANADIFAWSTVDMPDIPPMKRAGLAICPVDAVPEVRAVSDYISHLEGGQGAVRDIIEQVLKVRGDWTFEDK